MNHLSTFKSTYLLGCLPLEIAQGVKGLVLQEIMLEDLSQTFWTVTLSEYNGKVAFCKGWPEFSKDMNLEIGDALVFYYIKKDEDGKHKQHCMDEECVLMINRDDGYHQSDYNKCVLYDFPCFEMPQTACTTSVTRKGRDGSSKDKNPSETTILNDRSAINLALIANVSRSLAMGSQSPPKTSKRKLGEQLCFPLKCRLVATYEREGRHFYSCTNEQSIGEASIIVRDPRGKAWESTYHEKHGLHSLAASWLVINAENNIQTGDRLIVSLVDSRSNEYRPSNPPMRDHENNSFAAIPGNKVDPIYVPSSTVNTVNRLAKIYGGHITKSIKFENGIGEESIILRDPRGKARESTYHENHGLRSLTASWPVINAENNIQPGDRLIVSLVDSRSNEYRPGNPPMREHEDNSFAATLGSKGNSKTYATGGVDNFPSSLPSIKFENGIVACRQLNLRMVSVRHPSFFEIQEGKHGRALITRNMSTKTILLQLHQGTKEYIPNSTYHEKHGLRSLAASWPVINTEINIQPGDHLIVSLVNSRSNEYRFDIIVWSVDGVLKVNLRKYAIQINVNSLMSCSRPGNPPMREHEDKSFVATPRNKGNSKTYATGGVDEYIPNVKHYSFPSLPPFLHFHFHFLYSLQDFNIYKSHRYACPFLLYNVYRFEQEPLLGEEISLNLPSSLPSIKFENGIGEASIILRDPRGKAWECTYHEKHGLRSLAASWPVINAENKIQPTDRLMVSLVDSRSNEYRFDIVRNPVGN
ncbi:hypothetical protein M9H77_24290 [Catharanthus roseus]|uniref:Uncharacterized protein n=1 Tax=Catharanthus roseus TaxID=4058 RepID=A0ACC0AYC6_CATRO|nr:hypothetical protein M9H77_24290 [Catharanthus roseus]